MTGPVPVGDVIADLLPVEVLHDLDHRRRLRDTALTEIGDPANHERLAAEVAEYRYQITPEGLRVSIDETNREITARLRLAELDLREGWSR